MSDPGTALFGRWRGGKKKALATLEVGGNVDRPSLAPPDCPPHERAAALAALDELHRSRPLKPPTRARA